MQIIHPFYSPAGKTIQPSYTNYPFSPSPSQKESKTHNATWPFHPFHPQFACVQLQHHLAPQLLLLQALLQRLPARVQRGGGGSVTRRPLQEPDGAMAPEVQLGAWAAGCQLMNFWLVRQGVGNGMTPVSKPWAALRESRKGSFPTNWVIPYRAPAPFFWGLQNCIQSRV